MRPSTSPASSTNTPASGSPPRDVYMRMSTLVEPWVRNKETEAGERREMSSALGARNGGYSYRAVAELALLAVVMNAQVMHTGMHTTSVPHCDGHNSTTTRAGRTPCSKTQP